MLVKCCFLETILRYCGSGIEPHSLQNYLYNSFHIILELTPHHFIHNTNVALYNLNYFGADILIHIIRYGDAM